MHTEESETLEVEWQFEAPDLAFVVEWLTHGNHAGFVVGPLPTHRLNDQYFDTADFRVLHGGFAARIRRRDRRSVLTLKARADAATGPVSRTEYTVPVTGTTAERALSARGETGALLRALVGTRELQMLFSLQTVRARYDLASATGTVLGEVDLDTTTIRRGKTPLALLHRVEVEVLPEHVEAAEPFIEQLVTACRLSRAQRSKLGTAMFAAGLAAVDPAETIVGAKTFTLDQTIGDALFAALRSHMSTAAQQESPARAGLDPEALHEMRVSIRRARTLLRLFRPVAGPEGRTFEREIGWQARVLGEVRDLDVQIAWLTEARTHLAAEQAAATAPVMQLLAEHHAEARTRMLAALDSPRYVAFDRLFREWLERGPDPTRRETQTPLPQAALATVSRWVDRVTKDGLRIDADSPDEVLHELRKDLRRLRYLVDFLRPVYGAAFDRWRARIVELQDVLGLHQDAVVTRELLQSLIDDGLVRDPGLAFALGMLAEHNRRRAQEQRDQFPSAFSRFGATRWDAARRSLEKNARS